MSRSRVDAGLTSRWFEPFIEIGCRDGSSLRQYLERAARGLRYLNLPCALDDRATGARLVRLRGRYVGWPDQKSELVVFHDPPLSELRILVVAPHPDDAEMVAFGLYSNRDTWIVTVSAGNYADERLARLLDERDDRKLLTSRLRTWDSIVVPLWGGAPPSRSVNLGYSG